MNTEDFKTNEEVRAALENAYTEIKKRCNVDLVINYNVYAIFSYLKMKNIEHSGDNIGEDIEGFQVWTFSNGLKFAITCFDNIALFIDPRFKNVYSINSHKGEIVRFNEETQTAWTLNGKIFYFPESFHYDFYKDLFKENQEASRERAEFLKKSDTLTLNGEPQKFGASVFHDLLEQVPPQDMQRDSAIIGEAQAVFGGRNVYYFGQFFKDHCTITLTCAYTCKNALERIENERATQKFLNTELICPNCKQEIKRFEMLSKYNCRKCQGGLND